MKKKITVGITGQSGFIGWHLYNRIKLLDDEFTCVEFKKDFFNDEKKLNDFVKECSVIVHLAAVNRHNDLNILYNSNIALTNKLLLACKNANAKPHIIFASSTQEEKENLYGKSKLECRRLFANWAKKYNTHFTGLIIPNVFGEFCKPNYNSVVATFAHKLINNEKPEIIKNDEISFIYINSLCKKIIEILTTRTAKKIETLEINCDFNLKIMELLELFKYFKLTYIEKKIIPECKDENELNLFNSFRSYQDVEKTYPIKLTKHSDDRGDFVETIKSYLQGQISFSTTKPNVTRGNHFHTRKIERFTVIKGKAKIELRKIGTKKKYSFIVEAPGFVDMPVWYTHNVTNIGSEDLYMQFWINEFYNPDDADTFYEKV